jgi:hypothetical protein
MAPPRLTRLITMGNSGARRVGTTLAKNGSGVLTNIVTKVSLASPHLVNIGNQTNIKRKITHVKSK